MEDLGFEICIIYKNSRKIIYHSKSNIIDIGSYPVLIGALLYGFIFLDKAFFLKRLRFLKIKLLATYEITNEKSDINEGKA
jgi:hypothetical protein